MTYDLVSLKRDNPAFQAINDDLYREYQDFFAMRESFAEYLDDPQLSSSNPCFSPFHDTISMEITHNSGGILSIRETSEWWMGGVYNMNYSGMTYDLNSGLELSIPDLLGIESTAILPLLRNIVTEFIMRDENNYYQFWNTTDTIDRFTLSDYEYCVENGKLVLLFDTYVLGPGASGPFKIPTDLPTVTLSVSDGAGGNGTISVSLNGR